MRSNKVVIIIEMKRRMKRKENICRKFYEVEKQNVITTIRLKKGKEGD